MPLDSLGFAHDDLPSCLKEVPYFSDEELQRDYANAALVIQRALELLARGWTRCSYAKYWLIPVPLYYCSFATRYCSKGALLRAGYELNINTEFAESILARAIGARGARGVVEWNDAKGSSKAMVLSGFQAALHNARTQAG